MYLSEKKICEGRPQCGDGSSQGGLLKCATRSLLWCLWNERNSWIFEDKCASCNFFFGWLCNIQPLGGVQLTPNSFVIMVFPWILTVGRLLFSSLFWGVVSIHYLLSVYSCFWLAYEYAYLFPIKKFIQNYPWDSLEEKKFYNFFHIKSFSFMILYSLLSLLGVLDIGFFLCN